MTAATPVRVTALSEHPSAPEGLAIVVEAGTAIIGVARRGQTGWTTATRAGVFRRRMIHTVHDSAYAAVGAIMGSRIGRQVGVEAWSEVRWTDAAARAARDAWGSGMSREREVAASAQRPGRPSPVEQAADGGAAPASAAMAVTAASPGAAPASEVTAGRPRLLMAAGPVDLRAAASRAVTR